MAAPCVLEKVPAAQAEQLDAPGMLLYVPRAQGVQTFAPSAENSPSSQQRVDPAALTVPLAQGTQVSSLEAPTAVLKVFAGQGVQVALGCEKKPAAQTGEQAAAPARLKLPATQGTQALAFCCIEEGL